MGIYYPLPNQLKSTIVFKKNFNPLCHYLNLTLTPKKDGILLCICTMSQYFKHFLEKVASQKCHYVFQNWFLHHEKTRNTISNWKNGITAEPNQFFFFLRHTLQNQDHEHEQLQHGLHPSPLQ